MENVIQVEKVNDKSTKYGLAIALALGIVVAAPSLPKLIYIFQSENPAHFYEHVMLIERGMEECSKKYGNHASCSLDKLEADGLISSDVAARSAGENPWGGIYQIKPFENGWEIKATKLTSPKICEETAAHYAGFNSVSAACSGTDLTVTVK